MQSFHDGHFIKLSTSINLITMWLRVSSYAGVQAVTSERNCITVMPKLHDYNFDSRLMPHALYLLNALHERKSLC